ncbi:MAG: serine protease [Dehalococcoidia bacterium]|nr:serine protease [Dehalococcoidia bacterium]
MRTSPALRRVAVIAALLWGAVFLVACERTAELIPGQATPTPTGAEATVTPTATPIIVTPGTDGATGGATGGQVIEDHRLALSVVQILAVDNRAGFEQVVRFGTGVVVDTDQALIATAYPVVSPQSSSGVPAYTSIIVATDREPGGVPQREYRAQVVAANPQGDVAILRVTSDLADEPLEAGAFDLPAVVMGETANAGIGFGLRLFGYPGGTPGEASQVVNTAQASVTGQRGSVAVRGRTWFKTDARMPFGAAGGPAFDRFGALVGILAQDRYTSTGQVGQVRPLDLLLPLLEDARNGEAYQPALYRSGMMPGTLQQAPGTGIYVSQPAFAENAVETANGRDLFDYQTRFMAGLGALYYEYEVVGAPAGATVEERWFLDDVQQESLSSNAAWTGGGFGLVTDRITVPTPNGIPSGRWRLEVWVDGVMHARATAVVGVDLAQPAGSFALAASLANPDGTMAAGAFSGAGQLLMMFDLTGMEAVNEVHWVIFRDGQRSYVSPSLHWEYGDAGRFWVGYRSTEAIGPGFWEFELHGDGRILTTGSVQLF